MKKLVFGLFVLGLTSLGFSQNKIEEIKEIELEDLVISSINKDYIKKVVDNSTADFVKLMELNAASYDIAKCPDFDGRSDFFQVLLKGDKGEILASYDKNGKIVKTTEYYRDVIIPKNIPASIFSRYPKSTILKLVYTVDYDNQKDVVRTYKIQIMNGNLKKNLKITSVGNVNQSITMLE